MRGHVIGRIPAGDLHLGDEIFYRRKFDSGWVRVRSVDPQGRWVNGTDKRGRARSIRPDDITRIREQGATR